uniref:Lnc RNA pou2af1 n=1 Tax=Amphiprion percula TaxID=161767 RepID=A0A3P8S2P1_AMPPE
MSEKQRVYQGVRVKTTVKELLQRHRAREASSKKLKTTSVQLFRSLHLDGFWCLSLNPMDHNSYSPQDSFSSSSSSCYDSPTRMESSFRGFTSELYHYQHCTPQDCYCLPHCWPAPQESFPAPEYAPYYNPTDLPYVCPVEENYFRRDLPVSSDM